MAVQYNTSTGQTHPENFMECFLWKNYVLYSEKYNYKKQKIMSQHLLIYWTQWKQ